MKIRQSIHTDKGGIKNGTLVNINDWGAVIHVGVWLHRNDFIDQRSFFLKPEKRLDKDLSSFIAMLYVEYNIICRYIYPPQSLKS